MHTHFVVTSIVRHNGKILILQKSDDDVHYPGKWSFVSGYVKEFEAAEDTAIREIMEETGLSAAIGRNGRVIEMVDAQKKKRWIAQVYFCSVGSDNVRLCHENKDFAWVSEDEFSNYDFVPGLETNLKKLEVTKT